MKIGTRITAAVAGVLALGGAAGAQFDKIADYYGRNNFPSVSIRTDERDADVVDKLNLRAVLAVLKYELARKDTFSSLSAAERGQLIALLADSRLVLEYTGLQERQAVTRGGQAINKDLVRFDQAAFFVSGEPRPAHFVAGIILHELGHVWQLRHGWGTFTPFKEGWPEELESSLPAANFDAAVLSRVAGLLAGKKEAEPAAAFAADTVGFDGTWQVTSTWTKPRKASATWRFQVEALSGSQCRIRAGGNMFLGTVEGNTLTWSDEGLGIHKIVTYIFRRDGDMLTGDFKGKDRLDNDIEGKYTGSRVSED